MSECLFCLIANKKVPADFVYEDDKIVVFKDIRPKANIHLLVVPRVHVVSLNQINDSHRDVIFYALSKMSMLAKQQGLNSGFRTIINTGPAGGQEIDHIHLHLLGGSKLPGF